MDRSKSTSQSNSEAEAVSLLKEELCLMQNKLKHFEELPKDVAIQVRLRKEIAKKYEKKLEIFMKELLKGENISRVQFIILEDEKKSSVEGESYFCNEQTATSQNRDVASLKLPFYDQSFDEPLGFDPESNEIPEETKSQGMRCFNCLGAHHMKDCPEQHDGSRIASNKRDLMDAPTVRYHTDDVQPLENSILRPGYISNKLREALSLKPNQLPIYIYNMRILGYPPGWMKEAEIEASGLTVYDSNGNAIGNNEDNDLASSEAVSQQYDGKKFIAFPGFNTPVPDGMIDEFKELKMPPLQKHQLLSEALKHERVVISPECKRKKQKSEDHQAEDKIKSDCNNGLVKTPIKTTSDDSNSKRRSGGVVLSGSPLINTGNPYKKLPDSNKFAEGMSEFLPYENLPDAVGAFDKKMRGVLDDVREKLSKQ